MFRIFAVISVLALTLSACKNPAPVGVCDFGSAGAATGIAMALKCQDSSAIQADIKAYLEKQNVCQSTVATGTVGDLLCPMIASYVVSFANGQIPAAWKCDIGNSPIPVQKTLEDICKKAVTM